MTAEAGSRLAADGAGDSEAAGRDHAGPVPLRAIGRWALTAVVINSVIGSGIFGLPSALAGLAGTLSPLTVLLAGASVFLIVLCFAEVGSRFDQSGGPYLFAREAFGPGIAFQVGWLHLCTRMLSAAAVLNVLASYLSGIIPWVGTSAGRAFAMTVAVVIATTVNLIGVRQAAWTVNAFTIAKLLPLLGVILLGAFFFRSEVFGAQAVAQPNWTDAVLLLIFGYGGFESSIVAAGETRHPHRDTAFALIVAMLAITAIYCLMQLVVIGVLPNAKDHPAPIAGTLGELVGPSGALIGALAVVVSVYGWLLGFLLTSPRILYSMGTRGEMPRMFGKVHEVWRTPYVSVVFCAAVGLALALAGSFTQLATFSALSRLVIYISTCAALIALRGRGETAGFRAPGGNVTAGLAIAFCLWLLSTRNLAQAWPVPLMMIAGVVIWLAMRSRSD